MDRIVDALSWEQMPGCLVSLLADVTAAAQGVRAATLRMVAFCKEEGVLGGPTHAILDSLVRHAMPYLSATWANGDPVKPEVAWVLEDFLFGDLCKRRNRYPRGLRLLIWAILAHFDLEQLALDCLDTSLPVPTRFSYSRSNMAKVLKFSDKPTW